MGGDSGPKRRGRVLWGTVAFAVPQTARPKRLRTSRGRALGERQPVGLGDGLWVGEGRGRRERK